MYLVIILLRLITPFFPLCLVGVDFPIHPCLIPEATTNVSLRAGEHTARPLVPWVGEHAVLTLTTGSRNRRRNMPHTTRTV